MSEFMIVLGLLIVAWASGFLFGLAFGYWQWSNRLKQDFTDKALDLLWNWTKRDYD